MTDDRGLLTASQAAEALNASSQTIRNWIRAEHLHAVRIGNRFLIPRSEVERMRGAAAAPHGENPWEYDPDAPAEPLPRTGARDSASGSAEPPPGRLMSDSEQAFEDARWVWREALRAHVLAPPDAGFSARLDAFSSAAAQRAQACAAAATALNRRPLEAERSRLTSCSRAPAGAAPRSSGRSSTKRSPSSIA